MVIALARESIEPLNSPCTIRMALGQGPRASKSSRSGDPRFICGSAEDQCVMSILPKITCHTEDFGFNAE